MPITGANGNGGFAGRTGKDFDNCYAAVVMPPVFLNSNGGFAGVDHADTDYVNCFWDTDVSDTGFGVAGGNKA